MSTIFDTYKKIWYGWKHKEPLDENISVVSNAIKLWQLTCYDVIGIVATNTTYTMQIILAAWFNGLAFHAIYPEQKEEAIHYLLSKTKPKVIFCGGLYLAALQNTVQTYYPIICTLCNQIDTYEDVIKIENLFGNRGR